METFEKIVDLDTLSAIADTLREQVKKIVLCHGDFELIHPGHLKHFEAAKQYGDVLFVTVTPDRNIDKGPGYPFFNERLRVESVAALHIVDYVALSPLPTAAETILKLKPDIYARHRESSVDREGNFTDELSQEIDALHSIGGEVRFTEEISFSATGLLNTYFPVFSEETAAFLDTFRRSYKADEVIEKLRDLRRMKVLVVGDAIVDEYHFCRATGKASKSAIVSTKFLYSESYAGGAVAVANHVAGFCQEVHIVTLIGPESTSRQFILDHLKTNIESKFFVKPEAPTVVKRRYVDPFLYSKMFEVCFYDDHDLSEELQLSVSDYLDRVVGGYDLVIVADFGHGFLGGKIIDVLCSNAKFLALNTQTNSQNMGYNLAFKYPRADYLCIDEQEAHLACHSRYGLLENTYQRLQEHFRSEMISITLGGRGASNMNRQGTVRYIPTLAHEIVDTVGAGDAFLSLTSPCVARGEHGDFIGFVGNAAGALAVRILGNKESVEPQALYRYISTLLK